MKTLEQHNNNSMRAYKQLNTYPRKNGIECPKCKAEMSDANAAILLSYPPQKNVVCETCGFKTNIIA